MTPPLIRLFLGLLCLISFGYAEFPLYDLAVNQTILLKHWRFKVEPANEEVDWSGEDFASERANWKSITLPSIWDHAPGEVSQPVPFQAGWFSTSHPVPKITNDQELALCFLGVKYITDVFVNGEYLGVHRGGYTPFLFTLPPEFSTAKNLEIVLRVDNQLDNQSIPKLKTGWDIYGGIDREAYLLVRPKVRPENVFVETTQNNDQLWQFKLSGDTIGQPSHPLKLRLKWQGDIQLEHIITDWTDGINLSLPLDNPKLWSPQDPALHTLELSWGDQQLRFPVGIREINWQKGKCVLNGKPQWLQGFGQHEFYPQAGSILSSAQRRQDLEMMKNLYGANTLRTGHYPQHPDLFNIADEIGLLLFTEVPVWQNNPNRLLSPMVWNNWIEPQLNEMIIRYRNHPSIFGWGVLNEISNAHPYIVQARETILRLDPTRGVAAVIASTHDFGINALTDFAARNLHYGWYHSRSVYKLREGVDQNLENAQGNAIWVAELGGMSKPGRLGGGFSDKVRGTETYQDKMTRFGLQYIFSRAEELAGISLWTWSDYERDRHPHNHGILSPTREPKLAAYTAMNLMAPPIVALGTEEKASLAIGEQFNADLFVFARNPQPGTLVQLHWQIRSATEIKKAGQQDITLGDQQATPAGTVHWPVTEKLSTPLHFLYLELRDQQDNFIHSQAIPFEASVITRPGVLRLPPHPDGKTHQASFYGMTFNVYPHTGFMLPLPAGNYEININGASQAFHINSTSFTDLSWEN